MQNFARARNKFIYSQNSYKKYTATEHEKKMKRVGKPRGKYNKKKMTNSHQSNIVRPALK